MEKLTKRKAFNFLRSYFDVLNKIEKDEDKLSFLMSIINKQFLDEDPEGLNFLVDLCYLSQKHAIETSVKGWKRVNKTDVMGNPVTDPTTNPNRSANTCSIIPPGRPSVPANADSRSMSGSKTRAPNSG